MWRGKGYWLFIIIASLPLVVRPGLWLADTPATDNDEYAQRVG